MLCIKAITLIIVSIHFLKQIHYTQENNIQNLACHLTYTDPALSQGNPVEAELSKYRPTEMCALQSKECDIAANNDPKNKVGSAWLQANATLFC